MCSAHHSTSSPLPSQPRFLKHQAERAARLERNRLCARECRQRKKGRDNDNQQLIDALRAEVSGHARTITKLELQVATLQAAAAVAAGADAVASIRTAHGGRSGSSAGAGPRHSGDGTGGEQGGGAVRASGMANRGSSSRSSGRSSGRSSSSGGSNVEGGLGTANSARLPPRKRMGVSKKRSPPAFGDAGDLHDSGNGGSSSSSNSDGSSSDSMFPPAKSIKTDAGSAGAWSHAGGGTETGTETGTTSLTLHPAASWAAEAPPPSNLPSNAGSTATHNAVLTATAAAAIVAAVAAGSVP